VSKSKVKDAWDMPEGAELEMGNWELQVDATMDEQHFRSVANILPLTSGPYHLFQEVA